MTAQDNVMIEGHERVLLAALMNGQAELPVTADDFSSPPNRTIYNRLVGLTNRGLLALTDALQRNGELERVGGAGRITEIATLPHDAENLEYALDEVLEHSRTRRAAKIGDALHKGDIALNEAVERLSQLNERRASQFPLIEDAANLISKPIITPDDIIKGVLHRGAKMVLGGSSKSFKTWTLIDTAVSVATGTDWLGKFPTRRGRVLYINLEIQSGFFARRIKTICDERQVKIESGYLRVLNLRGYAADLSKLLPRLLRAIGREQFDLIILDPVYKLLGTRDENKAGDIATLLNEVELLAVTTGAAVAFGAHYSKGNQSQKESIDRIGGSGVFARDPDTILNFTRHEQADCFTVDATLRNHPQIEPFVVRWKYPLMCPDDTLDPARLRKVKIGPQTKYQVQHLVEVLVAETSKRGGIAGPKTSEFQRRVCEETGMSRATFYELLRQGKGKYFRNEDDLWQVVQKVQ